MSAALVRKSLAFVDSSFDSKASKKKKTAVDFLPSDKKFAKNIYKKNKGKDHLTKTKKLTVQEAHHKLKSKQEILQSNLKKLELIRKICTVDLGSEVTSQLYKRAVTRRPVHLKSKKPQRKQEKTAFTEEDFKKFEAESNGKPTIHDDNIFKLGTPVGLLLFLGFMGFLFIGLLSVYTLYVLYVGKIRGVR
ncbi:hypothetical protein Trydic_g2848 [Trypoxylus dichotomus]